MTSAPRSPAFVRRGTACRARLPLCDHPHSELNPFRRNAYKKARGPLQRAPRLDIHCRGAIHCALFAQSSNPAARNRRLPPESRAHPHSELNPFRRNVYKNKGVLVEP
jgi:hypothetical protein